MKKFLLLFLLIASISIFVLVYPFMDKLLRIDSFKENRILAVSSKNPVTGQTIMKITSINPKIKAKRIEASGVLWNPETSDYLLINDEEKKDQAGVYIMDKKGVISERLSMKGLDKKGLDDLESISLEGGFFYILSSLSHNSKGKLKNKRKKFVRFKSQNHQVSALQEIDLYKILVAIKDDQVTDELLVNFLTQAIDDHSMDIESHNVYGNDLYLGFKSPFVDADKTMIVKLHDVASLFDDCIARAEIWQTLALPDPETGEPMQLSDMLMVNDQLFLLSVSGTANKKSVLWHYLPGEKTLEVLKIFSGLKAEGLSYQTDESMFMVVFDEGKKSRSRFSLIPYEISGN